MYDLITRINLILSYLMTQGLLYVYSAIVSTFFFYIFYVFIKIINTFNHMVYISEYQPTSLGQSNHFTQFSAILCHQRPRCKNLYPFIFFLNFSLTIYDFNNIFETRNHMIDLSDNKPINSCLHNCLMPFSALYNHCLTRNRRIPLYFSDIFHPSSMPS